MRVGDLVRFVSPGMARAHPDAVFRIVELLPDVGPTAWQLALVSGSYYAHLPGDEIGWDHERNLALVQPAIPSSEEVK